MNRTINLFIYEHSLPILALSSSKENKFDIRVRTKLYLVKSQLLSNCLISEYVYGVPFCALYKAKLGRLAKLSFVDGQSALRSCLYFERQ